MSDDWRKSLFEAWQAERDPMLAEAFGDFASRLLMTLAYGRALEFVGEARRRNVALNFQRRTLGDSFVLERNGVHVTVERNLLTVRVTATKLLGGVREWTPDANLARLGEQADQVVRWCAEQLSSPF